MTQQMYLWNASEGNAYLQIGDRNNPLVLARLDGAAGVVRTGFVTPEDIDALPIEPEIKGIVYAAISGNLFTPYRNVYPDFIV